MDNDLFEGVFLPLKRYSILAQCAQSLRDSLGSANTYHLGGGYYAETTASSQNVHLTKYDYDIKSDTWAINVEDGVTLKQQQFDLFITYLQDVENVIPELTVLTPCYLQEDHQNQYGFLTCPECNPSYGNYC